MAYKTVQRSLQNIWYYGRYPIDRHLLVKKILTEQFLMMVKFVIHYLKLSLG